MSWTNTREDHLKIVRELEACLCEMVTVHRTHYNIYGGARG